MNDHDVRLTLWPFAHSTSSQPSSFQNRFAPQRGQSKPDGYLALKSGRSQVSRFANRLLAMRQPRDLVKRDDSGGWAMCLTANHRTKASIRIWLSSRVKCENANLAGFEGNPRQHVLIERWSHNNKPPADGSPGRERRTGGLNPQPAQGADRRFPNDRSRSKSPSAIESDRSAC